MSTSYLPFTLTLEARAVISSVGGDPNSSSTLSYIPGSMLRGAVARALGDPGTDPTSGAYRAFHDLVLSDAVSYLNAYPRIANHRSVPVPRSLLRAKYPQHEEGATAASEVEAFDLLGPAEPEERLADLPYDFLSLGAAGLALGSPAAGARVHHQRDRKMGRAWTERNGNVEVARGAVYAYEYLEAGQAFDGVVVLRGSGEEIAGRHERLREALPEKLLLGRSRRGGYGGDATLGWHEPAKREVIGFGTEGLAPLTGDLSAGDRFRVLLTSPYLGRDEPTGQAAPTWFEHELLRRLAEACGQSEGSARVVKRWWGFETAGGFNRKWRLELPQTLALAAGSVLLLEAEVDIPAAALAKVEDAGLGERRVEGFGRVVFLDAPVARLRLERANLAPVEAPSPKGTTPPALIKTLERRLLASRALAAVERKAALLAKGARRIPPNSLLGRLRTPLRGDAASGLERLRVWLGDGDDALKAPARRHLDSCRIGCQDAGTGEPMKGVVLSAWLRDQAAGDRVAGVLGLPALAHRHHLRSEEEALSTLQELETELSARLVDAVLAALAVLKESGDSQREKGKAS